MKRILASIIVFTAIWTAAYSIYHDNFIEFFALTGMLGLCTWMNYEKTL